MASISDVDSCIDPTANCPTGKVELIVGDGENAELSILACHELDTCGTQFSHITDDSGSISVGPSAAIGVGETCTYGFFSKDSEAPMVTIVGGSSFATSGIETTIYSYTLDSRLAASESN